VISLVDWTYESTAKGAEYTNVTVTDQTPSRSVLPYPFSNRLSAYSIDNPLTL
jgi:hypothetical protein